MSDRTAYSILTGIGIAAALTIAYFITGIIGNKACLGHGYPQSKFDYSFNIYCVKRVDQTDVVTPLNELER